MSAVVAVAPISSVNLTEQSRAAKAAHAAKQFEGVLLDSLFSGLEQAFSALPGKKQDSAGDTYHAMGMQALTTSLADAGGIGIARMITGHLLMSGRTMPQEAQVQATKVSLSNAEGTGIWDTQQHGNKNALRRH